jgi:probable HAF family extracellular repeat protein
MKVRIAALLFVLFLAVLAFVLLSRRGSPQFLTYTLTPSHAMGGFNVQPLAINDHGQVVGRSAEHAFLWNEMTGITDLGALGGSRSCATAVNDSEQSTGWSHDPQLIHTTPTITTVPSSGTQACE